MEMKANSNGDHTLSNCGLTKLEQIFQISDGLEIFQEEKDTQQGAE